MPRSESTTKTYLEDMINHHADSIPFEKQGGPFEPESLRKSIEDIPQDWLESEAAMNAFCERIRLAREGEFPAGKKMSQAEVARQLGISIEAYSKKERAPRKIDQTDLMNLCLLYRILPHYLLGLTEDPYEMYTTQIKGSEEIGGDSNEKKAVHRKPASLLLCTPSNQVRDRCRTVLFNLYKDPELFGLFLQLAEMKLPVQQSVLLRFKDLPSLRDCPVEAQMRLVSKDDFQKKWTIFAVSKNEKEREQLREYMRIFAYLGQSNFECLDFMTRVALSPEKTRNAVKWLLEETGLFK